jgi:hypothetical protein
MTIETKNIAAVLFMQKLQGLDLSDLDNGLKAMSVEAANIFPMIADDEADADRDGGIGMATRRALLQSSIFRIDPKDKGELPALSLEQSIIIDGDGLIVDGRNRVAAVIRNAGALPLIDYAALAEEPSQIGIKYREILSAKPGAMAMLEIAAGKTAATFNEADLLFRHINVEADNDAAQFTRVMNLNMARRDLTTSQRGCVAANFSQATAKKFGFGSKPTDG